MALWRLRATVDDRPGFLAVLAASLALRSINILSVQVHATEAGAVDDFLIDAPESLSAEDILAAVHRGRGRDPWVARTDVHGLVDEPTRVLGLAGRVAADPDELGAALAALLPDATVTWRPGPVNGREGCTDTMIQLADPDGGALLIHRDSPAFTPAEFARAHALVQVAAAPGGAAWDSGADAFGGTSR
jgi:hypothetical protein